MSKISQKQERVKYIRVLEIFANSVKTAIKKPDFDAEKLNHTILQKQKLLQKTSPQPLNDEYFKLLEELVKECQKTPLDKDLLQSKINQIDRLKNQKYKKPKHKNKIFEAF